MCDNVSVIKAPGQLAIISGNAEREHSKANHAKYEENKKKKRTKLMWLVDVKFFFFKYALLILENNLSNPLI